MQLRRKWSALACAAILVAFSGCGKKASLDGAQGTVPPETFIPVQEFLGAGIYNEEVLRQLNHDIMIGEKKFTLPCSLAALGEDFSFYVNPNTKETYVFEQEANGLAELELCYRGERVATVYYVLYNEENHDYSRDLIRKINISSEKIPFSIGGIQAGKAVREDLTEKLGEPTTQYDLNNGGKILEYGDNRITFRLNENGTVCGAWMWVNTDPQPAEEDSADPEFEYSGTYNGDVFEKLNQDILIGGRSFSLPFTLQDLGAGFTFQKGHDTDKVSAEVSEDGKTAILRLCFYGEKIAYAEVPLEDEGFDYSETPIRGIRFVGDNCRCSVGGIEVKRSTKQDVLTALGNPDKLLNFVTRNQELIYGNRNFVAELDGSGMVTGVQIHLDGAAQADQPAAMPGYTPFQAEGTCNRQTLREMAKDVEISGKRMALPCALRDFGEDFSLLTDPDTEKPVYYIHEDIGVARAFVCFREQTAALVEYPLSQEEGHDYSQDAICGIQLDENYSLGVEDITVSMGGLTVSSSTKEDVIQALGQPEQQTDREDGTQYLTYSGGSFSVSINADGFLASIAFAGMDILEIQE